MSPVLVDFYNTNYTGDIFVEASFSDVCLANIIFIRFIVPALDLDPKLEYTTID